MAHIQSNAEVAVRNLLRDVAASNSDGKLVATEQMDDGSKLHLEVSIDTEKVGLGFLFHALNECYLMCCREYEYFK